MRQSRGLPAYLMLLFQSLLLALPDRPSNSVGVYHCWLCLTHRPLPPEHNTTLSVQVRTAQQRVRRWKMTRATYPWSLTEHKPGLPEWAGFLLAFTWPQPALIEDSTGVPAADRQLVVVDWRVPVVLGARVFVLGWGQRCWWSLWTCRTHRGTKQTPKEWWTSLMLEFQFSLLFLFKMFKPGSLWTPQKQ